MDFWYLPKLSVRAFLLLPLSFLFHLIAIHRRRHRNPIAYPKPVVVVGNITVGGTGKTPTLIWLIDALQKSGLRPAVVSRGYKAKPKRSYPVAIEDSYTAEEAGDEPLLIKRRTGVPVIIDPERHRAVEHLCQHYSSDIDVILSDDGMQHYQLFRDLEIAMVDPQRGFGNKQLLPSGPLRESLSRLRTCDWVLSKSKPAQGIQVSEAAHAEYGDVVNDVGRVLSPQPVRLMSGIGNFDSFRQSIQSLGFTVAEEQVFADHEHIADSFFAGSTMPVVVTEKDFVKLQNPASHIYFLPYDLQYSSQLAESIVSKVQELIHEKSGHYPRSL